LRWEGNIFFKKWSLEEEPDDLRAFDIGIMPLIEDEWSTGKSGYKLIQYMATGIPCLASAVGVNKDIIEEGVTGFLVNGPQEWIEKLSILIENDGLRKSMGARGRQKAEKYYSYQANAVKLIDIIASLSSKDA